MSPAKSKDPTPPKKTTKAKAPAAETKPPATGAQLTSPQAVTHVDKTDAVTDGLTSADGPAPAESPAPSAPKVSYAKPTPSEPDSASKGSDTSPTTVSDAPAQPTSDMKAQEVPNPDEPANVGAQAVASGPQAATAKAGKPVGDAPSIVADVQTKAPAVTGPTSAGKPPTLEPEASVPAEDSGQPATAPHSDAPAVPDAPAAQSADEPMELPKGALIAFRKSGGLKFSSREVVVYPDGRVTHDGGDTAKSPLTRAARRMSDAQVMRLRRMLDQTNFFGMRPPQSQPDPDGFVIEISARLGGKNNHVEVNASGMPGALTALVEQLTLLLPSDE